MSRHIGCLGPRFWIARAFIVSVVAFGPMRAAAPLGDQVLPVLNPPQAHVAAYARTLSAVVVAPALAGPQMSIDIPSHLSVHAQPFWLAGWAIDTDATSGTGVGAVQVWGYPNPGSGQTPVFFGVAAYGDARPDVGAAFGAQFMNSSWALLVSGQPAGVYEIHVYAFSTVTGTYNQERYVTVTLPSPDAPMSGSFAQPILGVSGRHFTVNGVPRFLLFVSYFDAMRRSDSNGTNSGDLDTDFAYIKAQGYDGIRVFPNWQHYVTTGKADDDALFTNGLGIRLDRLAVFLRVLNTAASYGLVVDVSFSWESVTGMTKAQFYQQVADVTARLQGAYPHVMFDLQNEWNNPNIGFSQSEVATLLNDYVRPNDQNRIVTASITEDNANVAGQASASLGLDIAAYHDPRWSDWYTNSRVSAAIDGVRSGFGQKPIYLQEPMPIATICPPKCPGPATQLDTDPSHAMRAANAAKRYGAAAWTFHTRSTFDLASTTFKAVLDGDSLQKAAFESLRDYVNTLHPSHSWPSLSGSSFLEMQLDGNLVLHDSAGNALWHSATQYYPDRLGLVVKRDGNLTMWHGAPIVPYWTSNSSSATNTTFVVGNNGQLTVYDASGSVVWSNGSGGSGILSGGATLYPSSFLNSPDGRYRLSFQGDGNLVLYNEFEVATWATNTFSLNSRAEFQTDGNLVLYDSGGAFYWASNTSNNPGALLRLDNAGNLDIVSSAGGLIRHLAGSSGPNDVGMK